MKTNALVVCLLVIAGLTVAYDASQCDAGEADVEFLLAGVARIAAPGVPGPLSVFGSEAFPVISVASDGETREPVVAAARVGRGRVVTFGHPGYLSAEAFASGDTGRFVANALRWAADKPKATASQLRVGAYQLGSAARWLRDHEVPVDELAAVNDAQDLKACDVICVVPSRLRENLQREAIKNYLSGGGGLLLADLGWGWQQLNPARPYPPTIPAIDCLPMPASSGPTDT